MASTILESYSVFRGLSYKHRGYIHCETSLCFFLLLICLTSIYIRWTKEPRREGIFFFSTPIFTKPNQTHSNKCMNWRHNSILFSWHQLSEAVEIKHTEYSLYCLYGIWYREQWIHRRGICSFLGTGSLVTLRFTHQCHLKKRSASNVPPYWLPLENFTAGLIAAHLAVRLLFLY